MVSCERRGSGFSPIRAAEIEYCPGCLLREDIAVPLVLKTFKPSAIKQQQGEQINSLVLDRRPEGMGI